MFDWFLKRKISEDLKHLSKRIEYKETIRRDFVANVSHELKTPITAIKGLVDTLLMDVEMDPETRLSFLARIGSQNQRMADLVSDLMRLSKLESEEDHFQMSIIDWRQPIEASVQGMRDAAAVRGIFLLTFIPQEPVTVVGDSEALRQMLDNLIRNAIQFSPDGGKIEIRLAQQNSREAVLEVEDHGSGIDKKHLGRIFERFYRVDTGRSREIGGTGLGLAIVKHIAMVHRGEVSVKSRVGRGSVFRVSLPVV